MKKNSPKSDGVVRNPVPKQKPRLLFVGEGPQDVGREEYPGGAAAGFLQAALMGPGNPVEAEGLAFVIAAMRQWTMLPVPSPKTKKRSFGDLMSLNTEGDRVRAALVLARTQGLDGVFVLKDCEQQGRFDLQDTLRHAREVFEANDPMTSRPRLVVATPSRAHETWLLADPNAVISVFGPKGVYAFSKSPESRPPSEKLKSHITSHSDRCHLNPAESRRRLAYGASPKTLSSQCPKCYPTFLKDVDDELRPLTEDLAVAIVECADG